MTSLKTSLKSTNKNSNRYAIFQPDQILRNSDLNDLVDFIDQQARVTRTGLVGAGIASGLNCRWNEGDDGVGRLTVSSGVGVTSEGYLIQFKENESFTKYKKVALTKGDFGVSAPPEAIEAFELVESGTETLDEAFIDSKVTVLLLRIEDKEDDRYPGDLPETRGDLRKFETRTLLMEQSIASDLIKENLKSHLQREFELAELYLERFGYDFDEGRVDLRAIESHELFVEFYQKVMETAGARVTSAINAAYQVFSKLFPNLNLPSLDVDLPNGNEQFIQYYYDHLSDLVLAFNEFREIAFDLIDAGEAAPSWFPQHLFLGKISADAEFPSPSEGERTPFFQPLVYNNNHSRVNSAQLLFKRLQVMINHFELPDMTGEAEDIRITPSNVGDVKLGQRAIPFYYQPDNIQKCWKLDQTHRGRTRSHSYHRSPPPDNADPDLPYDAPLVYDLEAYNFLRIEGHVGLELEKAEARIIDLRADYNLPFEIIVLRLGQHDDADESSELHFLFHEFAKLHPGMEHKAGVLRGGTFVLVYDVKSDGGGPIATVVADFCLPYFCNVKPPELKKNPLSESVVLTGELKKLLAERREKRLKEMKELAEANAASDLDDTQSYKNVLEFTKTSIPNKTIEELLSEFGTIVKKIAPVIKSADVDHKEKFKALARLATRVVLDGVATKVLNKGDIELLTTQFGELRATTLKLKPVFASWFEGIETHLGSERTEAIRSLIEANES